MSQCVPNWDLSDPPPSASTGRPPFYPPSATHDVVPMFEYEVAELTWENGQLAMHGLGLPRVTAKIQHAAAGGGGSKCTWDSKPTRASGTLESLVNQGTRQGKIIAFDVSTDDEGGGGGSGGGTDLVPWFSDHHRQTPQTPAASAATTMDAMVPCDGDTAAADGTGKAAAESSDIPVAARVEDEEGRVIHGKRGRMVARVEDEEGRVIHGKRGRMVARVVHPTREWSGCQNQISVSGSAATFGRESDQKVTLDTRDRDFAVGGGGGFAATTATSQGSLDNTSSGKRCIKTTTTATDDRDSVCHSTHQVEEEDEGDRRKENAKSSVSTKRSRAAAIHNQSERKRRDKINQRMKTLQKLVPNSNKTDKASMLDEVIEYLKQLQAQVQMMSRMSMPMMLPMAMQQQLPMASLMAPMGLAGMGMAGMGMGLGMDHLNMIASRSGLATGMAPLLHPTAFMPVAAWDGGTCDQLQPSPRTMMADPFSTFLACQSQPMTMEAYNRIALMFQQLHQHPPMASGSKN